MTDSPVGGLIGAAIGIYALGAINKQFNSKRKEDDIGPCERCRRPTRGKLMINDYGHLKEIRACKDYPHCYYKSGKLF